MELNKTEYHLHKLRVKRKQRAKDNLWKDGKTRAKELEKEAQHPEQMKLWQPD